MNRHTYRMALAALVSLAASCTIARGQVDIAVYGEGYAEDGIPAAETDGWALSFSEVWVGVSDATIAAENFELSTVLNLVEATAGQGQTIATVGVDIGEYRNRGGFALNELRLVGSATRDSETKTFDWTIPLNERYSACETTTLVQADKVARFVITIHLDHLFADSVVAEDPALGFTVFANADTNADGVISTEELAASGIGALDPGNASVANLAEWLALAARSIGHIDGEGHCQLEP